MGVIVLVLVAGLVLLGLIALVLVMRSRNLKRHGSLAGMNRPGSGIRQTGTLIGPPPGAEDDGVRRDLPPLDFEQENMVRALLSEFQRQTGIDLAKDPMARERLQDAARKYKTDLLIKGQVRIDLPFITADQNGPKHLSITLTREMIGS